MIYLDNAATSFPKPPEVTRTVCGVMEKIGGNPGRGSHKGALTGARIIEACRERVCRLLGINTPERVFFGLNGTDALNMAIKGYLHQGDEVIVSHQEHNAVMRPLMGLQDRGLIRVQMAEPDERGVLSPQSLQPLISGKTALIILNHASNVTGCLQPASSLIRFAHQKGIPVLLDAAQTAGTEDLALPGADMIAMPGHKGLLGPMGTGILYAAPWMDVRPFREGGTGSASESLRQPDLMPDRMESGTHNLPGLAGLCQGIQFVLRNRAEIREYEHHLARHVENELRNMPHVQVMGHPERESTAVVSFNIQGKDAGEVCDLLGGLCFALRGGLHCAPSIHAFHGTQGAVRVSPGLYNTRAETDSLLQAIAKIQ